jgi:hypothetical protein
MTSMIFTVSEEPVGWFVQGHDKIGPFFSKQTAVDLAAGMVSALRAAGEAADMCIAGRPTPGLLAPEGRSFAEERAPTPVSVASSSHPADETGAKRVRAKHDRADEQRRDAIR